MKRYKLLYVIIAVIFLLCACEKKDNMYLSLSDSNKNMADLITINYSDEQLNQIYTYDGTLTQLNSEFPIECLPRKDKFEYLAVYRGAQKILLIHFDSNGDKILSEIFNISKMSSAFDNLTVGCSLDEVQKLDPSGNYIFLYTGRTDTPRISYHCTYDGYIIQIFYNDSYTVVGIEKNLL